MTSQPLTLYLLKMRARRTKSLSNSRDGTLEMLFMRNEGFEVAGKKVSSLASLGNSNQSKVYISE